jgi:hypothetical protein
MKQMSGLDFKIREMAARIRELREITRYTPEEMAASLYARLREAEKICDRLIIIEPADRTEKMVGVLNRLHKACASVDVPH